MPENVGESDIQGSRPRVSKASDRAGEGRKIGPVLGAKRDCSSNVMYEKNLYVMNMGEV